MDVVIVPVVIADTWQKVLVTVMVTVMDLQQMMAAEYVLVVTLDTRQRVIVTVMMTVLEVQRMIAVVYVLVVTVDMLLIVT